jgi:hypothetical protein
VKAAKVLAHGVVGGISSVLSGGKFGHGFASAGLTQALSGSIDGIDRGSRFSARRIVAAAVVGGTASTISGGKFANGAVTGAFSRAFNDEANHTPITEDGCDSCYPFGKEAQLTEDFLLPDVFAELQATYEGIKFNKAFGQSAEEYMAGIIRDNGYTVFERGVTLSVDGNIRYPDLTILDNSGNLVGFAEIKSGAARLIKRQIVRDRIIQTKGATIMTTPSASMLRPGPIGPTNVDLFRVLIPGT